MKKIYVCALGGTIAMAPDATKKPSAGVKPTLHGGDLVRAVPTLKNIADVEVKTLTSLGSANLSFSTAKEVIDEAAQWARGGATGIVVTQGTDTMEEMAFLLSLLWQGPIPIVVTGAMRHPGQDRADGPDNLLAAVRTALIAPKGVYVVMNGDIHDPLLVRKAHTQHLDSFTSDGGPIGKVLGEKVTFERAVSVKVFFEAHNALKDHRVALIAPQFDDDAWQLDAVEAGKFDGLVVAAFGGGHVSETWADRLRLLAKKMPIILASRTGAGRGLTKTYGYKGAEIDLLNAGLMSSGGLSPNKARILLRLALAQGAQNLPNIFAKF